MSTPPLPSIQPTEDRSPVAPVWHTVLFIAGIVGLSLAQYHQTGEVDAIHPQKRLPLYVLMIIFELFMVCYAWIGVFLAKKRLRDLIGGRWNKWIDFWRDVGIAAAFTIVA